MAETIESLDAKIAPLLAELNVLNRKIARLNGMRQKLVDQETKQALKGIPDNFDDMTSDQITFMLDTSGNKGMDHYRAMEKFLNKLGLSTNGVNVSTKQFSFKLTNHGDFYKQLNGAQKLMGYIRPCAIDGKMRKLIGVSNPNVEMTGIFSILIDDDRDEGEIGRYQIFNEYRHRPVFKDKFPTFEKAMAWVRDNIWFQSSDEDEL